MSEREIYLIYMPQIKVLIIEMNEEEYTNWKRETLETTPKEAEKFMEKVFTISDKARHCERPSLELCYFK